MSIPFSSTAGVAALRHRLGGPVEDSDGGGRYRCQGCGQMVPLSHTCTPPTPAAVLADAFPDHGGVLTAAQTEAEIDDMAEIDAFDGVAPLMAHSQTIRARRLTDTLVRSVA